MENFLRPRQIILQIHLRVFGCFFYCFLFRLFFKEFLPKIVRKVGAILFLFVPCLDFVTSTFVIAMASASQYDSRRHRNIAQKRPNFFSY